MISLSLTTGLKWNMSFNKEKCQAVNFGRATFIPWSKLGTLSLAWTENTKYVWLTIQSDLGFDGHIKKCFSSRNFFVESCTGLHVSMWHILGYVNVVCNPLTRSKIYG